MYKYSFYLVFSKNCILLFLQFIDQNQNLEIFCKATGQVLHIPLFVPQPMAQRRMCGSRQQHRLTTSTPQQCSPCSVEQGAPTTPRLQLTAWTCLPLRTSQNTAAHCRLVPGTTSWRLASGNTHDWAPTLHRKSCSSL